MSMNPQTRKSVTNAYTELHQFAVISPKLKMVFPSVISPVLEEDAYESMKAWRESMFRLNAAQHSDPSDTESILADLPITEATNSYTKIVNGRTELLEGEDGVHRSRDRFNIRFFPISSKHVNRINCSMLEQSFRISKIVYRSWLAARKTLAEYLQMSCEMNGKFCFKIFFHGPADPVLIYLKKLEQVVEQLGSTTKAIYLEATPIVDPEVGRQIFADYLDKEALEPLKAYMKLGRPHKMVKTNPALSA